MRVAERTIADPAPAERAADEDEREAEDDEEDEREVDDEDRVREHCVRRYGVDPVARGRAGSAIHSLQEPG